MFNILIMDEIFGEEIVHIIPLGFEIDRAVKPFEKLKANRVYILTIVEKGEYPKKFHDRQTYYLHEVERKLKEIDIQTKVIHTDIFDLLDVLGKICNIIRKERARKNIVYAQTGHSMFG